MNKAIDTPSVESCVDSSVATTARPVTGDGAAIVNGSVQLNDMEETFSHDAQERLPGGCCADLPGLRIEPSEAEALAGMFKAIGHPVRLQIVDLLSRYGGQVCVCDIEGHFELSQPTISHHLKILRQAQWVESENRGIWVYYHIRPDAVASLQTLLAEFSPQRV